MQNRQKSFRSANMREIKVYSMKEVGQFEQGPTQKGEGLHQETSACQHCWDTCGDPKWPIVFWVRNSRGIFLFPSETAPQVQFLAPPGLS